MAAGRTGKSLTRTFTKLTTTTTGLRRIARVNENNRDASIKGFICNKVLKLRERPGMDQESLLFSRLNSISDIFQVFHDNNISMFATVNNSSADHMIPVGHPTPFFSRKLSQSALGRLRAFGLQALAKFRVMFSGVHRLPARETLAFGRGCRVIQSHVNSYWIISRRNDNIFFKNDVDIKDFLVSVIKKYSRLWLLSCQQAALEIAEPEFDMLSACMGRDTDLFFRRNVAKGSRVVGHGSRVKSSWYLFAMNSVSYAGYSPDNQIGRQVIFGFELMIANALQFISVASLVFFSNIKNVITAIGKSLDIFYQNRLCFAINFKSAFNCFNCLHVMNYIT